MAKQNDIKNDNIQKLTAQHFENIFNVYQTNNGTYYYNILRSIYFPEDLDTDAYSTYITQPGDTWPFITHKMYRDIKLWWIICAVNQITNPVGQPKANTRLKILHIDNVRDVITQIGNE